jgi:(2Fe-2S) ferredoxin
MSRKIMNADDLARAAAAGTATLYPDRVKILIGSATCGLAMGARKIEETVIATLREIKADAMVTRTGCIGFCAREPLLDIVTPDGPRVSYGNMTPEKTRALLLAYFKNKDLKTDMALGRFSGEEHVSTGETHVYHAYPRSAKADTLNAAL